MDVALYIYIDFFLEENISGLYLIDQGDLHQRPDRQPNALLSLSLFRDVRCGAIYNWLGPRVWHQLSDHHIWNIYICQIRCVKCTMPIYRGPPLDNPNNCSICENHSEHGLAERIL